MRSPRAPAASATASSASSVDERPEPLSATLRPSPSHHHGCHSRPCRGRGDDRCARAQLRRSCASASRSRLIPWCRWVAHHRPTVGKPARRSASSGLAYAVRPPSSSRGPDVQGGRGPVVGRQTSAARRWSSVGTRPSAADQGRR